MLKRLLATLLAFLAVSVFAADANNASQADLEAIKGIGPATATRIVDERKNGAFKDWPDLIARIKGIGDKSAVKLSTAGLTVNGASLSGVPAAPAATKAVATAATPATTPAKATTPAPAAATATPAPAAAPASSAKELRKAAAAQKKADKAAAKASAAAAASAVRK